MRKFKNYNLFLVGFGRDVNGNRTIKLKFKNQRGFSIQIGGGCLPHTYSCGMYNGDIFDITDNDFMVIENEIVDYIEKYGSQNQRILLRVNSIS